MYLFKFNQVFLCDCEHDSKGNHLVTHYTGKFLEASYGAQGRPVEQSASTSYICTPSQLALVPSTKSG